MLYTLFLVIAILYNIRKFSKEKQVFIDSLINATTQQHREMILSHHFHIFIFEAFVGFIVSHLISEGAFAIGILGFGAVYLLMLGCGLFFYQYFLKFIERSTGLALRTSFNHHVIKEFRVSFALIMLPILMYSILNWTFQEEQSSEPGSWMLVEFLINIIFVSVLTISCTVIIMLRLLPNREITEPEYLEIINHRLSQIGMPNMRVKWIETDIKNAFVVGLKLLRFSNQTMFIGRQLRTMLTPEEFDAVIAHELAHVANRHIHKRVIELLKNFISAFLGFGILMLLTFTICHLYFGEDILLYQKHVAAVCGLTCIGWLFFNYSLFFDTIRSHEFEADAYAIIRMGASFQAFKSALEKLTKPEEMPEYLKHKTRSKENRSPYLKWIGRLFSTHPELSERIDSLEHKIETGLPFNHYVSRLQKMKGSLAIFLNWKVSAPLAGVIACLMTWTTLKVREGIVMVAYVREQTPDSIMDSRKISKEINSKPFLVGHSLMYYIVQRQDPNLIDHFLQEGADPGRTLIYLSETKNFDLFRTYYNALASNVSEDQYYLMLVRSADVNFTEGYRLLVNSSKFDSLPNGYKRDIARHQNQAKDRRPASATEN